MHEAEALLGEKIYATPFAKDYLDFMVSDVCLGIELIKDNGSVELANLIGPENSLTAKNQAPESLRAKFGKDNLRNALHVSENAEAATRELSYFFNEGVHAKQRNCSPSAILTNCSLLLIKPHII